MARKANNPGNLPKNGGPGRPKGSRNIIPQNVKKVVMAVFEELQGDKQRSLMAIAKKYPKWFYEKFGVALMPKDINLDFDQELIVNIVKYGKSKPTE